MVCVSGVIKGCGRETATQNLQCVSTNAVTYSRMKAISHQMTAVVSHLCCLYGDAAEGGRAQRSW